MVGIFRKLQRLPLFEKLRDKRGNMYIEVIVIVLSSLMILLLGLSTFSVVMQIQRINSSAEEIKRMVEVNGKYDSVMTEQAEQLLNDNNLKNTSVTCSSTGNIQLNVKFIITVTSSKKFGIGGISVISIPLKGTAVGFSDIYWK
jgi:predicted RNA-binding protein with PUA domain